MPASYICADCDHEFVPEEAGSDPRCPKCMRTEAVEPAGGSTLQSDIWRQWLFVFALLFIAGIAYVIFE
jgi:ribosomal protein S27E